MNRERINEHNVVLENETDTFLLNFLSDTAGIIKDATAPTGERRFKWETFVGNVHDCFGCQARRVPFVRIEYLANGYDELYQITSFSSSEEVWEATNTLFLSISNDKIVYKGVLRKK